MRAADAAREAFAIGWATATARQRLDLTPRARAACLAAMRTAEATPTGSTEPIIRLGKLEGVWAGIYTRRQKILDDGVAAAKAAWTKNKPDLPLLVHTVRSNMGLGEASPNTPPVIAGAAAELLNRQETLTELRLIIGENMGLAQAEGAVGALALAADEAGYAGFDFDLAFQDAIDALGGLDAFTGDSWTGQAADYVDQILNGSITDFGNRLAYLVRNEASYDDMLTAVEDLFGNADAVGYTVDLALSASLTQGALDLYTGEGVAEVNFVTAGDDRVDDPCEEAEIGSPYPIGIPFPQPPLHGFCRCCLQANDTLPDSVFSQYVTDQLDGN